MPLFEPAFAIPGAYARADMLLPVESGGWDLLEVKSSSNVWDDIARTQINAVYLQDIAFQLYVYRKAGLDIRQAYLVFLNGAYVRQGDIDPQQLFRREDVTLANGHMVTRIAQWDRPDWGSGGADFHWWCTEDPAAFVGATRVVDSMSEELVAIMGDAAYQKLLAVVNDRARRGTALPHPVLRRKN